MQEIKKLFFHQRLIIAILIVFGLMMFVFGLGSVGAVGIYTNEQCNVLKSVDSMIPFQLSWQNLSYDDWNYFDHTNYSYGSFDLLYFNKSTSVRSKRRQEVLFELISRYTINASNCYNGYDPYYLNSTIYNAWLIGTRNALIAANANGEFATGSGENPIMGEYMLKNYLVAKQFNSSIFNFTVNITYYKDLGILDDKVSTDRFYLAGSDRWSGPQNDVGNGITYVTKNNTFAYIYMGVGFDYDDDRNIDENFTLTFRFNSSQTLYVYKSDVNHGTTILLQSFVANSSWNTVTINYNSSNFSSGAQPYYRIYFNSNYANSSFDWVSINFTNINFENWYIDSLKRYAYINEYYYGTQYGSGGKYFVLNQEVPRAVFCYGVYNLTGYINASNCYNHSISAILSNISDGIFEEVNEPVSQTFPNRDTNPLATILKGYSSNYNGPSIGDFSYLYKLTGNSTLYSVLVNSFNPVFNLLIPFNNSLDLESGFSTRASDPNGIFRKSAEGGAESNEPMLYWLVPAFRVNDNSLINRIRYYFNKSMTSYYNLSSMWNYDVKFNGYSTGGMIDIFNDWNVTSVGSMLHNENPDDYLVSYNSTKFIVLKNNNKLFYASYGWATPTGGIISDVYNTNREKHLFSGYGASSSANIHYGLGVLSKSYGNGVAANITTNAWDGGSQLTILNNTYPKQIRFNGTLVFVNQSNTGITYNTTYTFYDNYIKVEQHTNSPVQLQISSVSTENIGNSQIDSGDMIIKNNVTFFPLFNLTYQNQDSNVSWGQVDNFNSSGTDFYYYLQLNGAYDFQDNGYLRIDNPYGYNINIQNKQLVNALLHNSTSLCNGSSSNINSNTGNINITLNPNQYCYVLDNYNITEGVTRENSPLAITQATHHTKHITNTLDETITTNLIFNVADCTNVGKITYNSHLGTKLIFQRSDYSCSDNKVTLTNIPIDPSTTSNILDIEYGCSSFTFIGYRIIGIFMSLIIPMTIFVFIRRKGWSNIELSDIVLMFLGIIIGTSFYLSSSQILGGSCGAIST